MLRFPNGTPVIVLIKGPSVQVYLTLHNIYVEFDLNYECFYLNIYLKKGNVHLVDMTSFCQYPSLTWVSKMDLSRWPTNYTARWLQLNLTLLLTNFFTSSWASNYKDNNKMAKFGCTDFNMAVIGHLRQWPLTFHYEMHGCKHYK